MILVVGRFFCLYVVGFCRKVGIAEAVACGLLKPGDCINFIFKHGRRIQHSWFIAAKSPASIDCLPGVKWTDQEGL
jgi:hypothetical protein